MCEHDFGGIFMTAPPCLRDCTIVVLTLPLCDHDDDHDDDDLYVSGSSPPLRLS